MRSRWRHRLIRAFIGGTVLSTLLGTAAISTITPRLAALASATSSTAPPFTQCPAVGADTSCRLLVALDSSGAPTILTDTTQAASFSARDNSEDTLIGFQNNSTFYVSALSVSSTTSNPVFKFDGDGACASTTSPRPAGCPFDKTGYAGPNTSLTPSPSSTKGGTVGFSTPVPPGGTAWFSLEGKQTASTLTVSVRAGSFSCRASSARLDGSIEPVVANPPDNPCAPASKSLLALGPLSVLDAQTSLSQGVLPAAGDSATAQASLASLAGVFDGHTIVINAVSSGAQVGCVVGKSGALGAIFNSGSSVASVTVDGQTFSGSQAEAIPLGPIMLYLNRVIFNATTSSLTQRAVEIDLNGSELIVAGESTVNFLGNPCVSQTTNGVPPAGSCQPSSSLSVLVNGTTVVSYVPKGNWGSGTTGVSAVNVEGSSITPKKIPTSQVVNSCASNPVTGETVCTANNNSVYLLKGTGITSTLASGGSGAIGFSGGDCTNCGVAMDAPHNRAVIGMSIAGRPGFQFLDLSSTTFGSPIVSPSGEISEDPLIDPSRNLLLSASEENNYEIANISDVSSPSFFEKNGIPASGVLDSSGEDCTTGIALAPTEGAAPSQVFIADLTQAKFTPGSPGTWTAPSQVQTLSESNLSAGASGIAVAQGTHTGIVSGEFGGNEITALALPTTSGSGTPSINDWVSCAISATFSDGYDPHTLTAYKSPNSGDAIALLANGDASQLARVDLTKLLNSSIVPRTAGGHACAAGTLPASVVSFITVP